MPIDTTHLDADSDNIMLARPALLATAQGVNALQAAGASALIPHTPAGTGAVATTVQAKLRERVSVIDFGADPSYAIDSTAAFQAAIVAGGANGIEVYVPNGTYRIEGTLFIGTYLGSNYHYVSLVGESTGGSVLLRPTGAGTGPIITINGFHNIIEKLTLLTDALPGAASFPASHGIYIRGNPQADTGGLGTKYCRFSNIALQRVGTAIQIGNYDVDGVDPDIETNSFHGITITECDGGVFINGQNILHNPFYYCHIVNCRNYLVKQTRGADLWFERSYFGGMFDYRGNNYNVAAAEKISATAGVVGFVGCRFEDWTAAVGNTTPRFAIKTNGSAMPIVYLSGNVFTTRDNATTEPSLSISGSGTAGSVTSKATLIDNYFGGYVYLDTIDVFSVGNTYLGTGASVVNGRELSANQKSGTFRDVFMDSNQTMELPGAKFKRNSSVPVTLERPAVATGSQFLGHYYSDEQGLLWGRIGKRITNGTAAAESSAFILQSRMAGALGTIGLAFGSAAPVAGTWDRGDWVINTLPAVGSPKGWRCTVAGTPGTWVSEGNL